MNIDYTPLDEKIPKVVKSNLTDIPKFNNLAGAIILTAILVPLLSAFNLLLITTTPIIFVLLYKYISKSGASSTRLSNFAVKNGFTYLWGVKGTNSFRKVSLIGVMGSVKSSIPASNIVTGKYNDYNFQLFCPYTKGNFTILKVNLHNQYPHIVLDSRSNNKYLSNIGHFFSDKDRIKLEGDFDSYFKAYAKAPAVDTLRILSPDMMAVMIDTGHNYDIEIIKDQLYIISTYKFSNSKDIESFFVVADSLLNKLDRRKATVQATFDSQARVT